MIASIPGTTAPTAVRRVADGHPDIAGGHVEDVVRGGFVPCVPDWRGAPPGRRFVERVLHVRRRVRLGRARVLFVSFSVKGSVWAIRHG